MVNSILDVILCILLYSFFTTSITSMILYSPGAESFRKWWTKKFKGRKLENLIYCSLCAGFQIAYWPLVVFLPPGEKYDLLIFNILNDLFIAFVIGTICALITWMITSWVQKNLYEKAKLEAEMKQINGNLLKGRRGQSERDTAE